LNQFLFPHQFLDTQSMTPIGVQKVFKNLCREAGIIGHSIHDLRHTCGRILALQNWSSLRIARHLRQKSTRSAAIYVDLKDDIQADQEIKSFFDKVF